MKQASITWPNLSVTSEGTVWLTNSPTVKKLRNKPRIPTSLSNQPTTRKIISNQKNLPSSIKQAIPLSVNVGTYIENTQETLHVISIKIPCSTSDLHRALASAVPKFKSGPSCVCLHFQEWSRNTHCNPGTTSAWSLAMLWFKAELQAPEGRYYRDSETDNGMKLKGKDRLKTIHKFSSFFKDKNLTT